MWTTPPVGKKYEPLFNTVSEKYGLPAGLLSKMAYIETGGTYNPKKVNPRTKASGMFQFMPNTARALKINPLNAEAATWAAGKYLNFLFEKFENWQEAIAAYNWGPGNVTRKGIENAPLETRNYISEIQNSINIG